VEEDIEVDAVDYVPYGISSTQGTSRSIPAAGLGNPADCSDPNVFKVSIIDSGLDAAHPDGPCSNVGSASANCVGKSFVGSSNNPDVDYPWYNPIGWNFHGTHVFGTIGAIGGNGGITSMIPDSSGVCYLITRVFDDSGSGASATKICEAIEWSIIEGADVINMSLGGGSFALMNILLQLAYQDGTLTVAAAGNNGDSRLFYPASYDNVMSVAAVN
jgi:serine protease